jgi:ribonucleoside-triphosphate reductase
LEIKYRTIKQRARENLLPFLTQKADGDQYFRIENASRLVSFVGLNETIESFFGKGLQEDETLDFAEKIVKYLSSNVQRSAKKPETRASLAMVPNADAAKRMAELDAEKYGWAKVRARGSREQPFYTDMVALPLEADVPWKKRLSVEEKFHKLTPGSHLALIQLADSEQNPNEILSATKEIVGNHAVGLYVFNRHLAYCASCQKTFYGILARCPSCGSVDMLHCFSRVSAKHLPSSLWLPAQRFALSKRASYALISG